MSSSYFSTSTHSELGSETRSLQYAAWLIPWYMVPAMPFVAWNKQDCLRLKPGLRVIVASLKQDQRPMNVTQGSLIMWMNSNPRDGVMVLWLPVFLLPPIGFLLSITFIKSVVATSDHKPLKFYWQSTSSNSWSPIEPWSICHQTHLFLQYL